jgi:hypothetical protein
MLENCIRVGYIVIIPLPESLLKILLRVTWEASLLGGSLLGDSFVNRQQYYMRC